MDGDRVYPLSLVQSGGRMNREAIAERVARSVLAAEPYRTLNDAAWETGDDGYEPGRVSIWYMKPSFFRDGLMGYRWLDENDIIPDPRNLKKTHIFLGRISETNLDKVYRMMQGEKWSPRGEARPVIQRKGLKHTSMSVGDIIMVGNKVYLVDMAGFKEL